MRRDRPLAVTAGGNPPPRSLSQMSGDPQGSGCGGIRGRRGGSAKLDIASCNQLGRVLPSDAAAM